MSDWSSDVCSSDLPRWRSTRSCASPPAFGRHAIDADDLLFPETEPKLGRIEDPVDHVETAVLAIVDQLGLPLRSDDEQWRRLAVRDRRGKFDVGPPAIVEGAQRPPCRLDRKSTRLNSSH